MGHDALARLWAAIERSRNGGAYDRPFGGDWSYVPAAVRGRAYPDNWPQRWLVQTWETV